MTIRHRNQHFLYNASITLIFFLFLFTTPLIADEESSELGDQEENNASNSKVHVFHDLVFKNDYITPRGLLVSNSGLTIQTLSLLTLDIYKNPKGLIQQISLTMGVWNDFWTDQNDPVVGSWNELDWLIAPSFTIADDWKLTTEYIEFLSPPGHFKPERNAEFTLAYNDSKWKSPINFNPYTKLFWAISGDSTVVVGQRGNTFYFEFGMIPTLDLKKSGWQIIWTAPTWFSVGPAAFWNGVREG